MAEQIHIQFSRFSAFYSPLIATVACGFLQEEGLEPVHSVATPAKPAIAGLKDGSVHVAQSAPSVSFAPLARGEKPPVMHFAQVNERDGFFLTARKADPDFAWEKLKKGRILVDHAEQPLAMFKYGCFRHGLDPAELSIVDAGIATMDAAFRKGEGDYIQQQGPLPQQLEHDGVGHIVASFADATEPLAFSSLCATPEWLATDAAKRFTRAYRKSREWLIGTPAAQVAEVEAPFFPAIDRAALAKAIAAYQRSGCWTPHIEITRPAFEVTLDVYEYNGLLKRRYSYDDVVAAPPA